MSQFKIKVEKELMQLQDLVTQANRLTFLAHKEIDTDYKIGLISGIALYLHSFYTRVERILEMIAKDIDQSLPTGSDWHKQLLQQMSIDIPNIRPKIITEETYQILQEFRGFRHIVRNLYAYQLEEERVLRLADILPDCYANFVKDIEILVKNI